MSDETGAPRSRPVTVRSIDFEALVRARDQLFAEAVVRYRAGDKWWPDSDFEAKHIRPQQDERFEADAWEAEIQKYLQDKNRVTVLEIARQCLAIETAKLGTADQRIRSGLTQLRWKPGRDYRGRFYAPVNVP